MGLIMNFEEELKSRTAKAERIFREALAEESGYTRTLAEAVNYSLLAGGKRMRPVLMEETYRMFGGQGHEIEPFMAGMEMIHTHSLVHDDLPALDNDDLRRGKATTHKEYGEAIAILAGDALLNQAYEVMLSAFSLPVDLRLVARALSLIAQKAGIRGMLGGQSVDVENEGKLIDEDMLLYVYENKTSALIEASMMSGAILAGASQKEVWTVCEAASRIGMAFQIVDDILDIVGEEGTLGKTIHSDEKNNKTTYVVLHGLDESREQVEKLTEEAVSLLKELDVDTTFLEEYVNHLARRCY